MGAGRVGGMRAAAPVRTEAGPAGRTGAAPGGPAGPPAGPAGAETGQTFTLLRRRGRADCRRYSEYRNDDDEASAETRQRRQQLSAVFATATSTTPSQLPVIWAWPPSGPAGL